MLDLSCPDVFFLQEVGGLAEAAAPYDQRSLSFEGRDYTAIVASPQKSFRALAVCVPTAVADFIESVHVLPACLLVVVKQLGIRNYLLAAHLPHALRDDCLQVWQEFGEQLGAQLDCMRYHDLLLGGADLNLEVHADSQGGERKGWLFSGI